MTLVGVRGEKGRTNGGITAKNRKKKRLQNRDLEERKAETLRGRDAWSISKASSPTRETLPGAKYTGRWPDASFKKIYPGGGRQR